MRVGDRVHGWSAERAKGAQVQVATEIEGDDWREAVGAPMTLAMPIWICALRKFWPIRRYFMPPAGALATGKVNAGRLSAAVFRSLKAGRITSSSGRMTVDSVLPVKGQINVLLRQKLALSGNLTCLRFPRAREYWSDYETAASTS